jgi:hypothetical protein
MQNTKIYETNTELKAKIDINTIILGDFSAIFLRRIYQPERRSTRK